MTTPQASADDTVAVWTDSTLSLSEGARDDERQRFLSNPSSRPLIPPSQLDGRSQEPSNLLRDGRTDARAAGEASFGAPSGSSSWVGPQVHRPPPWQHSRSDHTPKHHTPNPHTVITPPLTISRPHGADREVVQVLENAATPPDRGTIDSRTTRLSTVPSHVLQLARELRHECMANVTALIQLRTVQAVTVEEFQRTSIAHEEGQKQAKAVMDFELEEQRVEHQKRVESLENALDSERATAEAFSAEKAAQEKKLTDQLDQRGKELQDALTRIESLGATLEEERTRRLSCEATLQELKSMLEGFSEETATFRTDKRLVEGRMAVLNQLVTEITKSVERSAVGLQSCTPSSAIELCQRRTARPATLPLKGVKTATPPPAVLKHNAYLAELVNEVQVQRERTERLERDRDNAEQAEQARMEQATAETKSLHSKLKEAFQKVTSGRQTAASLRETLSAHQSALSATEVTVAELTNELEEARDEVARLTQQLASSEDKALSAESAATESSEAALQAGLRLEQAEARATMLAERGSDLQSQLVDAQARSTGSATSAEEAKAALLQAEARHKAAVARVSELEAAQSSEKEWTDAIRQAREEMKQAEVHESELIRALSKEKSRRMVVETQVQEIKARHKLVESDLTVANRKIRALQEQCANLSAAAAAASSAPRARSQKRTSSSDPQKKSSLPAFPSTRAPPVHQHQHQPNKKPGPSVLKPKKALAMKRRQSRTPENTSMESNHEFAADVDEGRSKSSSVTSQAHSVTDSPHLEKPDQHFVTPSPHPSMAKTAVRPDPPKAPHFAKEDASETKQLRIRSPLSNRTRPLDFRLSGIGSALDTSTAHLDEPIGSGKDETVTPILPVVKKPRLSRASGAPDTASMSLDPRKGTYEGSASDIAEPTSKGAETVVSAMPNPNDLSSDSRKRSVSFAPGTFGSPPPQKLAPATGPPPTPAPPPPSASSSVASDPAKFDFQAFFQKQEELEPILDLNL